MHDYNLALIGGAMIGLAAVMLMSTHGRIMGISGIVSGVLPPGNSDWRWRIIFLSGVLAAPLLFRIFTGNNYDIVVSDDLPMLVAGGLLVGAGSVIGGGCTSGHGVCGIPRLSPRSIVATCVFVATAFVSVFIVRHVF